MKRIVSLFICLVMLVLPLCSCTSFAADDRRLPANITGKEAAELLLTRERLREEAVGDALNFTTKSEALGAAISPHVTLLSADGTQGRTLPLAASVEIDTEGGRFLMNGNTWEWSKFAAYSEQIAFYESYVKNIESNAKNFADLIHTIKTRVNVTDRWLKIAGGEYLLTVGEMSETVFQRGEGYVGVCNHYVDEDGRDVYEMYSQNLHENGDRGEIYMVYIDGAHYEFMYDYIPADGDPARYFRPRVIVENSRGYWNMLCLSDIAATVEGGNSFPRRYNLGNLIAKDGVVYQVQVDMQPGISLSESNYGVSIISPDWSNDIVSFNAVNGYFSINAAAFEGVKAMRVDDVTASAHDTSCERLEPWGDPQRPTYSALGPGVSTELKNGKILHSGDVFANGKLTYWGGRASFGYGENKETNDPHGTVIYIGGSEFFINGYSEKKRPSAAELSQMLKMLLSELGLAPKYSMDSIVSAMEEAASFTENFGRYYEWNGYKVETVENLIAANEDYVQIFDVFAKCFDDVKDLPTADLNDYLEPLPETLDFADFSGYSYGKITVDGGEILAEEMIATLPEHVLFDEGSEYVLRLGLRKYREDGTTASETVVVLHGDNESYSTFRKGEAISFTQGAKYTIPSSLSEGKYLLVAFVATADEGIRVSKTVPLASVDFTAGTVQSEVADITYDRGSDDTLVIVSRSKLYTEVVLNADGSYDAAALLQLLKHAAMAKGSVEGDAVLERYDASTGQATPLDENTALTAGSYRLQYASPSHGNADAFVFCTLSAEMILTP